VLIAAFGSSPTRDPKPEAGCRDVVIAEEQDGNTLGIAWIWRETS
jgi:hypothetical protein